MNKKIAAVYCILFISVLAFSQDLDSTAGAMIRDGDLDALDVLFQESGQGAELTDLESYVLDAAKQYVIRGDYAYAQALAGVILLYNLENPEAQELYTSLESTIRQKQKAEEEARQKEAAQKQKEEEERLRLEAEQKAAEEEKRRIEESAAEEERRREEEQERIEEITVVDIGNFSFSFNAAVANLLLYHSDFYDDYYDTTKVNLKYGLGLDGAVYFRHPYVRAGLDASFDTAFVDLLEPSGVPFAYTILLSGTSPLINFPLYITTGFSHLIYSFDPEKTVVDVQTISIPSPVLGVRIGNVHFTNGLFGLDFTGLYYLSAMRRYSVEEEEMGFLEYDAVFDTALRFLFNFYTGEGIRWNAGLRLAANFIFVDGQLELNSKILLNIGAMLYAK